VKRFLLTASVLATLGMGLPAALEADPGGPNLQQPVLLTCSGGLHVEANPGTLTNRGRVLWATDSTSVFVDAYFAITDGTNTLVIYDSKKGLKNLITCTADLGGGISAIATGFFTPR
jgi:hypothetical protein